MKWLIGLDFILFFWKETMPVKVLNIIEYFNLKFNFHLIKFSD